LFYSFIQLYAFHILRLKIFQCRENKTNKPHFKWVRLYRCRKFYNFWMNLSLYLLSYIIYKVFTFEKSYKIIVTSKNSCFYSSDLFYFYKCCYAGRLYYNIGKKQSFITDINLTNERMFALSRRKKWILFDNIQNEQSRIIYLKSIGTLVLEENSLNSFIFKDLRLKPKNFSLKSLWLGFL
jgi:hypothetical protein